MSVNTRVLVNDFEYIQASSLGEVLELLDRHGADAKVLAGGTDLVIQMKLGRKTPKLVVDISKLQELKELEDGATVRIGAGCRYVDALELLKRNGRCHSLVEAIESIGKIQVLAVGSIGGNLCNGSPKSDTAPPLITYGAKVRVMSAHAERIIPLREFHAGFNKTVMATNEVMTSIEFDAPDERMASAFRKIARVACDISKLTCAVALARDGDVCSWCRIALGAAGPVPQQPEAAAALLAGQTIDDALLDQVADEVSRAIDPPKAGRCSAEYRREAAGVLFKDAFATAWERARC
jgi:CO/xanthine dehydrogenase FAD-binding subunit